MLQHKIAIFFTLLALANTQGSTYSAESCNEYITASGTITLAEDDTETFCWRIVVETSPKKQVKGLALDFTAFDFDSGMKLQLFSAQDAIQGELVAEYTGLLGDDTAPQADLIIDGGEMLLALDGTGNRTFTVAWEVDAYELNLSLNFFYSLLIVFLIPAGLTLIPCLPCLEDAVSNEKRERAILILFLAGSIIGFVVFCVLIARTV